jgi:sarcosine oxidase subunit alpha
LLSQFPRRFSRLEQGWSERGVLRSTLTITVNGKPQEVLQGATVAAAILQAGTNSRISVRGGPRQPLCGMGICYECRVEIDGRPHQRSCQILCEPGMQVVTG